MERFRAEQDPGFAVASFFKEPQVSAYVEPEHVLRHYLYILEKRLGEPCFAEFLFQMFDMYGPAWTPMPVAFHFDFWDGFGGLEAEFVSNPKYAELASIYIKIRRYLLANVAKICQARRQAWLSEINRNVEQDYGNEQYGTAD